ncbi:MAG TPA: GNAT family N-acetyltransferase [Acidimicrobiales bacterium]|nr:GNAT family N-acetyltransferase [Acidimicrobiales bacterium]
MSGIRFELCDPEVAPAAALLAEMKSELIGAYEDFSRLDNPALSPGELRAPGGAYLVGFEGDEAVAGGGVRRLSDEVGEIKRMFVRPPARSRGLAAELLSAIEAVARKLGYLSVRLDTGPKQVHARSLYRASGYVEIEPYNDNPFASYWAEKQLMPLHQLGH